MAGCPAAWLWSVFHGGRRDWSGLNLYQLVLGCLSEMQGKKKIKTGEEKKTNQTNPTKIWGEGKEEKIKKGGWEEETRTKGENKIKKMENGKKKREKEKSK